MGIMELFFLLRLGIKPLQSIPFARFTLDKVQELARWHRIIELSLALLARGESLRLRFDLVERDLRRIIGVVCIYVYTLVRSRIAEINEVARGFLFLLGKVGC